MSTKSWASSERIQEKHYNKHLLNPQYTHLSSTVYNFDLYLKDIMELEKIQRTTEMIWDVEQLLYKENTEKAGTFQIKEEKVEGERFMYTKPWCWSIVWKKNQLHTKPCSNETKEQW